MAVSIYVRRTCACKAPNENSGGNNTSDVVTTVPAKARTRVGAVGARRS